jgi:hypothetical protein
MDIRRRPEFMMLCLVTVMVAFQTCCNDRQTSAGRQQILTGDQIKAAAALYETSLWPGLSAADSEALKRAILSDPEWVINHLSHVYLRALLDGQKPHIVQTDTLPGYQYHSVSNTSELPPRRQPHFFDQRKDLNDPEKHSL